MVAGNQAKNAINEFIRIFLLGTITVGNLGANGNITAAGSMSAGGSITVATAGQGFQIKEGSNARMGVTALINGTITVATTAVTANSRIFLTCQALGTVAAPKPLTVASIVANTSFDITSSDATDTSTIAWLIMEKQ